MYHNVTITGRLKENEVKYTKIEYDSPGAKKHEETLNRNVNQYTL